MKLTRHDPEPAPPPPVTYTLELAHHEMVDLYRFAEWGARDLETGSTLYEVACRLRMVLYGERFR